MLTVNNLSFGYNSRVPIISDLSMTIERGTVCGLLGRNGAGKSTLLYLICGLLKPAAGTINFDGYTPYDRQVGFLQDVFLVPEEFSLPSVSLDEYIKVNEPFYPKFDRDLMMRCLEIFELSANLNLGELSMGQKKKAFISFAMACNTSLVVLDEPTNGLDISAKRNFRKVVIESMNDDKCIIISTHQVYDVDKILDHVIITDRKGVLFNGGIDQISSQYRFGFTTDASRAAKALIALEVPGGMNIAEPLFDPNDETEVNLETFFELIQQKNR